MSESNLGYMVEFARAYPIHLPAGELPWTSHTALLSINDPKKRAALTAEAVDKNWTREQLRSELKKRKTSRHNKKSAAVEHSSTRLNVGKNLSGLWRKLEIVSVLVHIRPQHNGQFMNLHSISLIK